MRFPPKMLEHHKTRGSTLTCKACTERQRGVEALLREKGALKCTCKGQDHDYSNERCKLHMDRAGMPMKS